MASIALKYPYRQIYFIQVALLEETALNARQSVLNTGWTIVHVLTFHINYIAS
jgi:hypothetical protein